MFRPTPLAAALLVLGTTPLAFGHPEPAGAAVTAPVADGALPAVTVEGERDRDRYDASTTSLSKLPPDLRDVPQSVTVLNKALLQSQGATSLSDALRNVPGITLGGAEGGQIGNNINLNGFSARTDIYLDGFRDRGQYYRDLFALDSVEVLMGPSSMLFGRGSTGGVVNQVTKKPSLQQASEFTASVTTNGMVRTTVDHNQPLGATTALRVAAMAQDGRPSTRDSMRDRDAGLDVSLRTGIGTDDDIVLSALLQHNRDQPDYGISPLNGAPAPVDRDTFYGDTSDRLVQDVAALNASIEHHWSPRLGLREQVQYNDVRVDAVETASNTIGTVGARGFTALVPAATSALPLSQLAVRLQSHDRVIHDRSLVSQTELKALADTGPVQHDLLVGVELGRDTYDNQAYYRNGTCNGVALNPAGGMSGYVGCESLLDPPADPSPAAVTRSTGNHATSSANTVAGYVNDTATVGGGVKLVAGVRHDRYQASIDNSVNSANTAGVTTSPSQAQTVSYNSVRLGGIWQPNEAQAYYVSHSTSFNPSLEQLTITTGATNPLPPETNRADEVGGKWDWAQRASLNAAVFRITQSNSRAQGSDGSYTATGTVRVEGARAGASGQLTDRWKVFAGYAWLDARIIDAIAVGTLGRIPLNTPKHSATLWSTYDLGSHWEAGGGMATQSSRYLNNTNLVQVGADVRWDATLAYRRRSYDIRFNLFNLTDRKTYDALIQSDGGRAVPGTGRTGMLSVSYRI